MNAPRIRLNEREVNPNPYINFISPLETKQDHEAARHILKAVAAQMKPIMQKRFMVIGDLAEGKFNTAWAGLNRNHGQTIWLVLRNAGGRFLPLQYVVDVMCHEMAHIEQMNHGPKFQKLMAEIKKDVADLQRRGYFGDGLWSDGHRLSDGVRTGGVGLAAEDFPEHICAGVIHGKRSVPRRLAKREVGPSRSSGAQTKRIRKAGTRVVSDMGGGEGSRLDGKATITAEDRDRRRVDIDRRVQALTAAGSELKKARRQAAAEFDKSNPMFVDGKSRGKRAGSRSAAELRAAMAEKRMASLLAPKGELVLEERIKKKSEWDEADVTYLTPMKAQDDDSSDSADSDFKCEPYEAQSNIEPITKQELDLFRGGWQKYVTLSPDLESKVAVSVPAALG